MSDRDRTRVLTPKHYLAAPLPRRGRAPRASISDCREHPGCRRVEHASGAVQHVAVRVITADERGRLLAERQAAQEGQP
jgi:hypothetical protein